MHDHMGRDADRYWISLKQDEYPRISYLDALEQLINRSPSLPNDILDVHCGLCSAQLKSFPEDDFGTFENYFKLSHWGIGQRVATHIEPICEHLFAICPVCLFEFREDYAGVTRHLDVAAMDPDFKIVYPIQCDEWVVGHMFNNDVDDPNQSTEAKQVVAQPLPDSTDISQEWSRQIGILKDCMVVVPTERLIVCVSCREVHRASGHDADYLFAEDAYKLGWRPTHSHQLYGSLCPTCDLKRVPIDGK